MNAMNFSHVTCNGTNINWLKNWQMCFMIWWNRLSNGVKLPAVRMRFHTLYTPLHTWQPLNGLLAENGCTTFRTSGFFFPSEFPRECDFDRWKCAVAVVVVATAAAVGNSIWRKWIHFQFTVSVSRLVADYFSGFQFNWINDYVTDVWWLHHMGYKGISTPIKSYVITLYLAIIIHFIGRRLPVMKLMWFTLIVISVCWAAALSIDQLGWSISFCLIRYIFTVLSPVNIIQ